MSSANERLADSLSARRRELALRVAERHLVENPSFIERFGPAGRTRCAEDAEFHLRYLAQAARFGAPSLFTAYVQWARQLT